MGEVTNIEWADRSWSPWLGCMKVSTGEHGACENCYAQAMTEHRFHRVVFGGPGVGVGTRDLTSDGYWKQPIRWQRDLVAAGRRETVFPSLCDPFDNAVPPIWRVRFFNLIRETPNLIWLLLTKRPQNIIKLSAEAGGLPPNVILLATVVTQEEADRDLPHLLIAGAQLRPLDLGVSIEPMMGEMDIRWALSHRLDVGAGILARGHFSPGLETLRRIGWVIAGGESGAKARPSHPDWYRGLRDQCAAAGVPYLFKQWGEWTGIWAQNAPDDLSGYMLPGKPSADHTFADGEAVFRVGRKVAGRLLDGVEHNGFPAALKVAA